MFFVCFVLGSFFKKQHSVFPIKLIIQSSVVPLCQKHCGGLRRRKLKLTPSSPLLPHVSSTVCLPSLSSQTFTLLGRLSDV